MAHLRRGFRAENFDKMRKLKQAKNFEFDTVPPPPSQANGQAILWLLILVFAKLSHNCFKLVYFSSEIYFIA